LALPGVTARPGCELLSADKGAYINFLTLATTETEYRSKLSGALNHHGLQLFELVDVRPLSPSDASSEEILSIADELERSGNPQQVRYSTFHTFPRLM
jgi:hypothetical protein